MATTTELHIPYPGPGDPNNVPADMFALASWLEANMPRSGLYTPTLTNLTNIDTSSASPWRWTKIGNVMTVSGRMAVDPTAAGALELKASLPIESYLPATHSLSGIAGPVYAVADDAGFIEADTVNRLAVIQMIATATTVIATTVQFTYTLDPVPDP